MNASTTNNGSGSGRLKKWLPRILTGSLLAGLVAGLTACATTHQVRRGIEPSGFLGDTSMLHKGAKGQPDYFYIRPGVDWAKYTKVWLKPIELWKSDDPDSPLGRLPREDQQMLVNYLHHALDKTLSTEFTMVDHGGPDVLVIKAAITDGKKSRPVIGLVSSVYVPLKAISYGKQLLTGTAIGVGQAVVEGDVRDGQTNERLAAVIDSRAGTVAVRSKFGGTWGDVKLAYEWWAQHVAYHLARLKEGDTSTDKF